MGDLHEIVDREAVNRLFLLAALLAPPVGALIGAILGRRTHMVRRTAVRGLGIGLIGPLNLVLWQVFNTITDHNGLDTVRNLLINLALFVTLGALIGIGVGWAERRTGTESREPSTPSQNE